MAISKTEKKFSENLKKLYYKLSTEVEREKMDILKQLKNISPSNHLIKSYKTKKDQFFKNCFYYKNGSCKNGKFCKYYHKKVRIT